MNAHAPSTTPQHAQQATKVLVLCHRDDQRTRMVRAIEADGRGEVVSEVRVRTAADTFLAHGKADVLVIDARSVGAHIDEVLRSWTERSRRAIVVVTDDADTAILALSSGAIAAIHPPQVDDLGAPAAHHLRRAVAAAASSTPVHRPPTALHTLPDLPFSRAEQRIIAVAGGLGGTAALESLIAHLPPSVPSIIARVDVPSGWVDALATRLNRVGVLDVEVASHGTRVIPGTVYISPTDRLTTVTRQPDGSFVIELSERLTIPSTSGDFFRAIADNAGTSALGVLLGSSDPDAASGLGAMSAAGARTLAEAPESAVSAEAQRAALEAGFVDELTHLRRLPWRILEEALVTALPG